MHIRPVLFFCVAVLAISVMGAESNAPSLAIVNGAVVVDGIKPGGDAVLFGVSRVPKQYLSAIETTAEVVRDDDRDGRVTFTPSYTIPFRSQWIAIDLATGRVVLGAREGFAVDKKALGRDRLKATEAGHLRRLQMAMGDVAILWVRPAAGAWTTTTFDGARSDEDGRLNGQFTLVLQSMRAVGSSPAAPDGFENRDILVVADLAQVSMLVLGDTP